MRDYILFVDTETSGIPKSLGEPVSHTDKWPYILQLAWRIHDAGGTLIKEENHYIFEEEIQIEDTAEKIHGITIELLREQGEDRKSVIRMLVQNLRQYNPLVVGHFVEFDSKMLQVAMYRSGLKNHMKKYPHFCTMRASSEYTNMRDRDFLRLEELYQRLFREKLVNQHNAAADAEATAKSFFELYRRGDLTEQLIEHQPVFTRMKSGVKNRTGCGLPVLLILFIGLMACLL